MVGDVVLSNENPDKVFPDARVAPAPAIHWIPYPSPEPPPVMFAVHDVGEAMSVGLEGIKFSPGTQASQKVPRLVVPISLRTTSYFQVVEFS